VADPVKARTQNDLGYIRSADKLYVYPKFNYYRYFGYVRDLHSVNVGISDETRIVPLPAPILFLPHLTKMGGQILNISKYTKIIIKNQKIGLWGWGLQWVDVFDSRRRTVLSARATLAANHRAAVLVTSTELVGRNFGEYPTLLGLKSRAETNCSPKL
jgi:hypothetical protein